MARTIAGLVVCALALAGCNTTHELPPEGQRVPITQRAIAAIALEYLPDDTTTRQATYTDKRTPDGLLGADLRFGGGGEYDGDLVRISVQPLAEPEDPCSEYDDGCAELADETTLRWQEEVPEEDPGIVEVVRQSAGEQVSVYYAGPIITGDPREQDLPIPVSDLQAVAADPWLSLQTSPDAIAAGDELDDWEGGEQDPTRFDRVPNTDLGMVAAYVGWFGGSYTGFAPSPLADDLGAQAIGGRLVRLGHAGYGPHDLTIDALAAPDRDAWLGDDPCSRWDGPCRELPGKKGPLYLAWQPAAAGEDGLMWAATRRDDQVIAIRMTGPPVPESLGDVKVLTEWFLLAELLASGRIGVETDREVVDRGTDYETVPLTDRGSAVPVLDVISDPVEARPPDLDASGLPEGTVGSDLTFGEDRPDVRVRVVPGRLDDPCDRAQCAPLDTQVAGGTLRLVWHEASGSDPGFLYVALWLDDQTVVVEEHGPTINGDPREQDLDLGVDDLVRIAESPYLRLQTYLFAERAAQDIDVWTDEPADR